MKVEDIFDDSKAGDDAYNVLPLVQNIKDIDKM